MKVQCKTKKAGKKETKFKIKVNKS